MKRKLRYIVPMLSAVLLGGCSLSLPGEDEINEEEVKLQQLRDVGIIAYEESTLGIPVKTENITENMESGMYYVIHNNTLYPCYADTQTYDYGDPPEYGPEYNNRFDIFTSESIVDIPTLFEGDKLYYYNEEGVLMYSTFERYKDLGWSIGLRNLKSTPAGYVYLNLEDEDEESPCILGSLESMRDISETSILIDKIGGIRLTSDYCENGIINGLIEGVSYDLEVYNGTNYYYYTSTVDTRYFQSFEVYRLDKYLPLQDYLYEIEIPEWLPEGYYDVDGVGMFRYVKGKQYDDNTDFNKRLLYQYTLHEPGDDSLAEEKAPGAYSENKDLNEFRAYDEGYFGYDDTIPDYMKTSEELETERLAAEAEKKSELGMANFLAASKTSTQIWLPADRDFVITVDSKESTGSICLVYDGGRSIRMPYDRIAKTYSCTGVGKGEIVSLEVKGLYSDYDILLENAESYHGQDKEIASAEGEAPAETQQ